MNCVKCGTSADCTDGTGQWWCKSDFPYICKENPAPEKLLTCNMHGTDEACRAAEAKAGKKLAHCHDDCCEDCFGT